MSLTLDSSLFYTLPHLITEDPHHLCSNAPDTLPLVEISFPQLYPHYFCCRLQTPNPAKSPCLPSLYCHPPLKCNNIKITGNQKLTPFLDLCCYKPFSNRTKGPYL